MNCAACHYYTRTLQEKKWGSGRCHRYPPTVVQLGDPEQRSACFPLVDESDWCGEHREPAEAKTSEAKTSEAKTKCDPC